MRGRGEVPPLPPNPAEYLTDWLFEIGPTSQGAMGEAPIGWRDLAAWSGQIGIELEPWEARLLVSLSGEYAAERYRARKASCPPPWNEFEDRPESARDRVTRQFAAMFAAFSRK